MSLSLDVRWCETWYLNLFGSKFDKYKVLAWPLSQKSDISLYGCKFDKWAGWNYPLYLVKWKALDVPCLENEIMAYMLLSMRNKKVELVLWFKTWYVYIFGFVFGKVKVLEWPLCKNENFAYMITCLIYMKVEVVPRCPLMRNVIFEPIWF